MLANEKKISISCILALHREGLLAHTTLNSILNARKHAESRGISVQCVVTLDRADAETQKLVTTHPLLKEGDDVEVVAFGDLGLSRNHGIALSSGEYILTLDGDDYYSENFITAMAEEAAKDDNSAVFPKFLFGFDAEYLCVQLGGPKNSTENLYALFSKHHYCSRVAAHRNVFERVKYAECPEGFGFEDWHWNCEASALGITLKTTADDTVLFYRRRDSMARNYAKKHALIPPSKFFELLPEPPGSLPIPQPEVFPEISLRVLIKDCVFFVLGVLPKRLAAKLYDYLRNKLPNCKSIDYPPTVRKALFEVAAVDGLLHPQMIPEVPYLEEPFYDLLPGMAYARVWHSLKIKEFDVVFLGPHISVAGERLMFANYMKAAAGAGKRVLCIITGDCDNDFSRIPADITVLAFGRLTKGLSEAQKKTVLARLLVQLASPIVHAVNDECSFEIIKTFGAALKHQSRIFASIFADTQDEQGIHYGMGTRFLRDLQPFCYRIINDNKLTAIEWSKRLGLPLSLFHPVYSAVELMPENGEDPKPPPQKVLWAGRLDKEKRLDILFQIAMLSPDIQFDVYGRTASETDLEICQLKALSNVAFCGPYEAFPSLPHKQYACLVYTKQCDGMPNVILEAVACGLPVVASAHGGIPDFISNDTGWVIKDHEDAAAFCRAIYMAILDRREARRRCDNARHILKERHSFIALQASLLAAYYS